ncbi:MAG: hypothetical protein JO133_15760 [Burkholderiaceae bacterium]|nr:hypothetical protein [Burkholderiaceae bacterium]
MKACALLSPRRNQRQNVLRTFAGRRLASWACTAALAVLVALAIWSDRAAAQASTQTQVGSIDQVQSGSSNQQQMRVGNVSGSATSGVTAGSLVQTQSGTSNRQVLDIGNAAGNGSTMVNLGSIVQQQSGTMNAQNMRIGNVSGNGSSTVSVGQVVQTQTGASGGDSIEIGNADNGNTDVQVGGVFNASTGHSMSSIRIGNR